MSARTEHLAFGEVTTAVYRQNAGAAREVFVDAGRAKLLVATRGTLELPTRGGEIVVREGHGALLTGPASVRFSSIQGGETVVVGVAAAELVDAAHPGASVLSIQDDLLLRPIGAFVSEMHAVHRRRSAPGSRIEAVLRSMLSAGLGRAAIDPITHRSTVERAIDVIRRRHPDSGLTPAAVAAELNMSLRQLDREFEPLGRTVRQEIRRIRVIEAVELLSDLTVPAQNIDIVALRVGLSNGSSLARAMANEGMPSPARLRASRVRGDRVRIGA